jgi:hypothetical protein
MLMIAENQTDEFFNDRLRDYSSSVPADMWNRIVEKKKRDRKILLFFFRLFGIVILSLALTGGYFIFNQKKSASAVGIDSMKINHRPFITDSIKAGLSNSPLGQVQIRLSQMNGVNKKKDQKEKVQRSYSGDVEHVRVNIPGKVSSSQTESPHKSFAAPGDSNEIEINKKALKNDSLGTILIVKASTQDSLRSKDLKKPEKEKKSDHGKWFLDVYVSPDYPIISPRENEQSKLSYSLGIKLNRSLRKHFSVKTGIQFSEVNIGSDSLPGGMTIHLMRLDLPVLAGYSLGNEKFKATFNGGAILNLYTWLRGNAVPDFFKTNTGLSLYLGVNLEKRINERISIFCEPYYRYQLTSMTVSSTSSMKFIDIAGINIGARYYFKK